MIRTAFIAAGIAGAFVASATSVRAQVYLARGGSGIACTLTAPCVSMQGAINIAAGAGAGGEIICLDKGSYGGAAINNSVTISCGDGLWEAPGELVNVNTPAGADVVIEGLVSDALTLSGGATVTFSGQGTLHLHRVRIGNAPGSNAHAISLTSSGGATLHVSQSVFYNNGGSGIFVRPTGSGFANVHIRDVKAERNANGLFADGSGSSVGINIDIVASVFAENSRNGIGAFSTPGSAGIGVSVKDAQIVGNIGNGVAVLTSAPSGAGSVAVEIGSSMISGNVTGVSASGAGQIRTFGNNQLRLNGNNGAFTGSVGLQ